MPATCPGNGTTANNATLAALLVAGAATLSAVDAVLVRLVSAEVHPFVIGFFRSVFGLLAFAPWIVTHRRLLATNHRALHAVRAVLKLLSLVAFYAAFAAASLADATAIMFTAPIFLTLGAALFLGERLGPGRIVGVLAGFAGALIVLRPDAGTVSPALLFALAGAALVAVAQLMLKSMSARDNTDTLVAWNLIVTAPLALVPAVFFWTTPSPAVLGLLVLQGVLGAINMAMMTRAFSLADASLVAPIDFLRLPAVALLGFVMFSEIPDTATWIGAAVIVGSALVVSNGERLVRIVRNNR
ncbi:DMT family transporter [Halomonas sp. EGI 63088]|uniref:DMT family transporter n=1 Tax=Halomonas flagellata TaxID=2920385 RepID=A0ABS9RQJ3_9GAMM|nr:DMT family transporter [Halomonas flagellata]MCH4562079.1 DMT family transporter [Halomonas flagellata]